MRHTSRHQRWMESRHSRDDWVWRRLYTVAVWAVRLLALPTALAAVLLLADTFVLPGGSPERYRPSRQVCEREHIAIATRICSLDLRSFEVEGHVTLGGDRYPVYRNRLNDVGVSRSFAAAVSASDTIYVHRTPLFEHVRRLELGTTGRSDGSYQLWALVVFAVAGFVPLAYWRSSATDLWEGFDHFEESDTDEPDDPFAPREPGFAPWVRLAAVVALEVVLIVKLVDLLP